MPDTPKHPVTLGDLLTIGPDRIRRPATVADLLEALAKEGVLRKVQPAPGYIGSKQKFETEWMERL